MLRSATSRLVQRVMLPVMLVSFTPACHKWSTVQEDPRDFIHRNDLRKELKVRVDRKSGGEIELVDPFVRGDTLVGSRNGEEVAIPLSDVRKLDKRTFDGLGTGFLIGAVVIVAGGLIGLAVAASQFELY